MKCWIVGLLLLVLGCSQPEKKLNVEIEEVTLESESDFEVPEFLSEWGLFEGSLVEFVPAKGVHPYELNSPLFSDYARKQRFVYLPDDSKAKYHKTEVLDFPIGSILVKNFFYNHVQSLPFSQFVIETRLLVREKNGWQAWTYKWNGEQTEAKLLLAGGNVEIDWLENGVLKKVMYSIPNKVQCKSCHEKNGELTPIGPTVGQLNRVVKDQNQFLGFAHLIENLPPEKDWPIIPVWNDEDVDIDLRARAWLDINCAHCHNKEGPAKNTGLNLTYEETDLYKLGFYKPPVAAGRGSGGMKYGILPGKPESSILYHRVQSLDPGVMMPEVGRRLRHEEGIELIKDWIASM